MPTPTKPGFIQAAVNKLVQARDAPIEYSAKHPKLTKGVISGILFVLYNVYLMGCLVRRQDKGLDWAWCDGIGFLIILTIIIYTGLFYYMIFLPVFGSTVKKNVTQPLGIFNASKKQFSFLLTLECTAINLVVE